MTVASGGDGIPYTTWLIAVPVGIYSATHQRSVLDHIFTVIKLSSASPPRTSCWRLILMWLAFAYFGLKYHRTVLTGVRRCAVEHGAGRRFAGAHLASGPGAWHRGTARLARIMRANLLDELNKPYVVTARAKGMREWRLVLRYPCGWRSIR